MHQSIDQSVGQSDSQSPIFFNHLLEMSSQESICSPGNLVNNINVMHNKVSIKAFEARILELHLAVPNREQIKPQSLSAKSLYRHNKFHRKCMLAVCLEWQFLLPFP